MPAGFFVACVNGSNAPGQIGAAAFRCAVRDPRPLQTRPRLLTGSLAQAQIGEPCSASASAPRAPPSSNHHFACRCRDPLVRPRCRSYAPPAQTRAQTLPASGRPSLTRPFTPELPARRGCGAFRWQAPPAARDRRAPNRLNSTVTAAELIAQC